MTISTGVITTIVGTGTSGYSGDGGAATSAALYTPAGVAVDTSGSAFYHIIGILTNDVIVGNIYIADTDNNVIRKVSASTGAITTISSGYGNPAGIAVDSSGTTIFFVKLLYTTNCVHRQCVHC